jgi:nucleoside recognition membrane protein YjiH
MRNSFIQKVLICMVAGFFAACLIEWGKVFVIGADDALNKGYKHRAPLQFTTAP